MEIYRKNFLLNILLESFWGLGSGFVVPATILAIFISNFTSSKIAIGFLFALPAIGTSLTPIFSAYYTGGLARKKKLLVGWHLVYVVCWFLLALFAFLSGKLVPEETIFFFFIIYGLSSLTVGLIVPPYLDYIGKIVPKGRGIYFGIAIAASGGFAILGAFLARRILSLTPFPGNYGLCFLSAASFQLFSLLFLGLNIEVEGPPVSQTKKFRPYLQNLIKILKEDREYLQLIFLQMITSFGAMSSPFYAVYASTKLQVTGSILGYFTIMLLLGGMIASVLLGILGDVFGHKISLLIAIVCGIGSATIALFGSSETHFYALFFLLGFSLTPTFMVCTNLVLEMASIEHRSSYLALNSTLVSPLAAVAPLLGGFLVRTFSYPVVFLLTIAVLLVGLFVLIKGLWPKSGQNMEGLKRDIAV